MRILAINPGGTSTKISVYDDKNEILKKSIVHTREDLKNYKKIFDEYEYRKSLILNVLEEEKIELNSIDATVGRGGLMKELIELMTK